METIKHEACGLVLSDMNLPMAACETSSVRIHVPFKKIRNLPTLATRYSLEGEMDLKVTSTYQH
ncbi:hypothetical protein NC651_007203 [Populus alba x Populus x berolinensis]|nr:hypothetical protein NC651_007203 [Populus alba x Populus x berolinensis]